MSEGEQDRRMREVIGRTWADEEFRRRMLSDPAAVLRAEGVEIPSGTEVRVVEDKPYLMHLVLPVKPVPDGELSDEDLGRVSGGARREPTSKGSYS